MVVTSSTPPAIAPPGPPTPSPVRGKPVVARSLTDHRAKVFQGTVRPRT